MMTLTAVDYDPFAGPAIEQVIPLTPGQVEIWLSSLQSDQASAAYNLSISFCSSQLLHSAALEHSLNALIKRHQALRSTIGRTEPVMCIFDDCPITLRCIDLSAANDETLFTRLQHEITQTPFDLAQGPLLRAVLIQRPTTWVLTLVVHHIIADGWSIDLIAEEITELYCAYQAQRDATLPAPYPFSHYAVQQQQQRQHAYQSAQDYWIKQLTPPPKALELPLCYPRPPLRSYAAARIDHSIDPECAHTLLQQLAQYGTTLFAFSYCIYLVLLHRLTHQDDLVVGIASAGQATLGAPQLLGHCVSALPVRHRLQPSLPFTDLLQQVQHSVYQAQDHSQLTFGELLSLIELPRDPARVPLMSSVFTIDLGRHSLNWAGQQVDYDHNARSYDTFELTLVLVKRDQQLQLQAHYNTQLFSAQAIQRWLQYYQTLLDSALAQPQQPIGQMTLLPRQESLWLHALNQTQHFTLLQTGLHQWVQQQCQRSAHRIAISYQPDLDQPAQQMTYAQLDQQSNQWAQFLLEQGVVPHTRVGICLYRSPKMVVAMLAVLKVGAAYVPLDPEYPATRIAALLVDASIPYLLTQTAILTSSLAQLTDSPSTWTAIDMEHSVDSLSDVPPQIPITVQHSAYVIYTSGSTGQPKGVVISHGNIVNLLKGMQHTPGITEQDHMLAIASISFDPHVFELFLPLVSGACVHIASREQTLDVQRLMAYIDHCSISIMQATPVTWRLLAQAQWQAKRPLKAISGGEAFPGDILPAILANTTGLWNAYGPTETTIIATLQRLESAQSPILIGHALPHYTTYVLDAQQQPVPIGVVGELYIGGAGVAQGYLNRDELTDQCFITAPFTEPVAAQESPKQRLYRTGDRVKRHENGALEYISRVDAQVKVRGFRIELGEVETTLIQHPGVAEALVRVQEDHPGDKRLVGYLRLQPAQDCSIDSLRHWLRQRLPAYMVPQTLIQVTEFTKTLNGKIDTQSLPQPDLAASSATQPTRPGPRNAIEQALAQQWCQLIGCTQISLQDNFFDIGGHSLLAMQLINWVQKTYGVTVVLQTLLLETFEQVAQQCGSKAVTTAPLEAVDSSQHWGQPFFFADQGQNLYGVLHPATVTPAARAVLICAPIGYEYTCTHRLLKAMADRLAQQGWPTLRFDYFATGDSQGLDREAQLQIWQHNILAAAEQLQQRSQCSAITVVAARLGATLYSQIAETLHLHYQVDQAIVWDPIVDLPQHVQQLHRLQLAITRDLNRFRSIKRLRTEPGYIELMGMQLPESLITQLHSITLQYTELNRLGISVDYILSQGYLNLPENKVLNSPKLCTTVINHACDWYDMARLDDAYTYRQLIDIVHSRIQQSSSDAL